MDNLALGVITNRIDSTSPYLDFLKNGSKYGHGISRLIIGYSHGYKRSVLEKLSRFTKIKLIKLPDDKNFIFQLMRLGLTEDEVNTLFNFKLFRKHKLIPYGIRRNSVLMKAMMLETVPDYLFFIDTDVYPFILTDTYGGGKEIDFFGRHLEFLKKEEVVITTSDYSGYYIIPPMSFDGIHKLLLGLQKETAINKLKDIKSNIATGRVEDRSIRITNKILGGNHALDLSLFKDIPPYFSTYYFHDKLMYLGRGEDTLLGRELAAKGKKVIDIDTKIFHDTYGNFPEPPDVKKNDIQLRFYYACLGWLGRNPFLNWYLNPDESKLQGRYNMRRKALIEGSRKLSEYLNNPEFEKLPAAFDSAYFQLEEMKKHYFNTVKTWKKFKNMLFERGETIESTVG